MTDEEDYELVPRNFQPSTAALELSYHYHGDTAYTFHGDDKTRFAIEFGIYVECSDLQFDGGLDPYISISIDDLKFEGLAGQDLTQLKLKSFECYRDGSGPQPSVYFESVHFRMGMLDFEIPEQRGDEVDFRVFLSDDIDGLEIDDIDIRFTATLPGMATKDDQKSLSGDQSIDVIIAAKEDDKHLQIKPAKRN